MSEHEDREQTPRPRKSKRSRLPLLLVTILLLAAAGAAIYYRPQPEAPGPAGTAVQRKAAPETGPPQQTTDQAALPEQSRARGMQETEPLGAEPQAEGGAQAGECAAVARKLHDFFRHVDQQDYLPQFALSMPVQAHFIAMADRLLANPPVVSREADDLYTILQNMAHFFRVIGKENIQLIKTILDRERDRTEDVAGQLYQWLTAEGCQEELLPFNPPLAKVYEYAGFFLNTMGGRSYLFRRDSRSRLLVNYYSILIIDRANGLGINQHGIDIGQAIPQLVQEIESSSQLANKDLYLDQLYRLQERLPQQNGTAE